MTDTSKVTFPNRLAKLQKNDITHPLERQIQKKILRCLRFNGIYAYPSKCVGIPDKKAKGGLRKAPVKGIPDITGFFDQRRYPALKGVAVYVEVKRPKEPLTFHQQLFLESAKTAGCFAMVAHSTEEVEAEMKKWTEPKLPNTQ